jgi:PKD repeat protein
MNTPRVVLTPMPVRMRRSARLVAALMTTLLGVSLVGLTALPASADTKPLDPTSPSSPTTASPDVLPTVQIDGVVWQQTVIGNTVYAVGQFTTARPAGAAPGVNTTPRNNILAFDIRTGALITSFNASLNAQARSVTASPDGKRIYVGGAFTQVNGVDRRYVAALDSTTGSLITSFAPLVNSRVYAIQATENAIYMGGWFTAIGSAKRDKLAAVAPSNAALLPWNPVVAGGSVSSLVLSPDRSKAVAGGDFTSVNGSTNPGAGWAAINTSTSALEPWLANSEIRNSGTKAAITGLTSDGVHVYASAYDYDGVGGAFEGVVAARWSDGAINWLQDCHGDTYAVWATESVLYTAGHAHYCGNIGGFPESTPNRAYNHALAFGKTPVGTVTRDTEGYRSFEGYRHAALLNWWPTFGIGNYTGQFQATWAVTGNAEYVVMGGEFPSVSGTPQQGLVRFGIGDKSPNKAAPEVRGGPFNPSIFSVKPGEARISWRANWDRDNTTLTYRIYRDHNLTAPIYETTKDSTFWQRPGMSFVDTGLAPGSKHTYRVFARDAYGNESRSDSVEVTVAAAGSVGPYAASIVDDGASSYWRLGEGSGTSVLDWAGVDNLTAGAGVTRGAAGAIAQDTDKASVFSGTETGIASGRTPQESPNTFTSEAWIKTTTTSGGKIIGFGASPTGNSGSYDRQVYMDNAGRLLFGVYAGGTRTLTSPTSYNDGQWHHVVSSLGPAGMALYVDGQLIGKRTDTTRGDVFSGYWRIGGDNLGGWPNQPTSSYFNGTIDDVAVYPKELTRSQIQAHYTASGREVVGPKKPADAYGAAVFGADPDLYWRLDEASGTTAADSSQAGSPGTYVRGITLGRSGALEGVANKAAAFDGSSGLLSSNTRYDNPTTYSQELWFTTTTTNGGKLIGFGDNPNDRSNNYDRHVYMENDGRLTFGVWTGQTDLAQSQAAYNDGKWHHMVATQSSAGMVLYVDGKAVGTNPQTGAQSYSGHWKVGSDNTWGPQPYFAGTIDEVAVYSRALPAAEVSEHYRLGGGAAPVVPNKAPVAAASVTAKDLTVAADGSASSDADGTIASYSWNFGDNTAAESGVTASHTYAAAGTYSVVLTVTDDKGATNAVTKSVTVTAPSVPAPTDPVLAADSFERQVASGLGSAEKGGAWALNGSPSLFSVAGGAGAIRISAAGSGPSAYLNSISSSNSESSVKFKMDKVGSGGGMFLYLTGRKVGTAEYRAKAWINSSGGVTLDTTKVINGTMTTLASRSVSGIRYTAGTQLQLKTQVVGVSPTTVRAKIWAVGTAEPAAWTVTASDAAPELQGAGSVGLMTYLSGSATNAPITLSFDDFTTTTITAP